MSSSKKSGRYDPASFFGILKGAFQKNRRKSKKRLSSRLTEIQKEREEDRRDSLMAAVKAVHSMIENPDIETRRARQAAVSRLAPKPKNILYEDFEIDGIRASFIVHDRPHNTSRAILHCHGGGYVTGNLDYAKVIGTLMAERTGYDTLVFEYRLAPENPYPAAVDDALAVWNYLMALGYGARDVAVTGESSGGNLALVLTEKLAASGRKLPGALALISPWTDLTSSGNSYTQNAETDPILSAEFLGYAVESYAAGIALSDPYISPLFADFAGFPPTLCQVGEIEILLDDSRILCEKMRESGVDVRYEEYPGMWHVFHTFPGKDSTAALDSIGQFLIEKLG